VTSTDVGFAAMLRTTKKVKPVITISVIHEDKSLVDKEFRFVIKQ